MAFEVDLLRREQPEVVRWSEVRTAFAGFGLVLDVARSAAVFDKTIAACRWKVEETQDKVMLKWASPAGELGLAASRKIAAAAEQNLLFQETLNGQTVPLVRLSEEPLAPRSR